LHDGKNRVGGDLSGTSAYGISITNSIDVLVANNRITTADGGIVFDLASTGKYMDNLTSGVTTPFSGGTAVGRVPADRLSVDRIRHGLKPHCVVNSHRDARGRGIVSCG